MLSLFTTLALMVPAQAQDEIASIAELTDGGESPVVLTASDVVGMTQEKFAAATNSTFRVHEMSSRTAGYAQASIYHAFGPPDNGAWRAHALQWKSHENPGITFDITAVAGSVSQGFTQSIADVPSCALLDDARLNAAELDTAVFASEPPGTWMCEETTDAAVAIVFAALVMDFWGSPSYVPFFFNYPSGDPYLGNYSHTAALELFMFDEPGSNLQTSCGLAAGAPPSAALTTPLACPPSLFHEAGVAMWNDYAFGGVPLSYNSYRTLSANDFNNAWSNTTTGPRSIVFDPPQDATEEDVQGLMVLAEALAAEMVVADANGLMIRFSDLVAEGEVLLEEATVATPDTNLDSVVDEVLIDLEVDPVLASAPGHAFVITKKTPLDIEGPEIEEEVAWGTLVSDAAGKLRVQFSAARGTKNFSVKVIPVDEDGYELDAPECEQAERTADDVLMLEESGATVRSCPALDGIEVKLK